MSPEEATALRGGSAATETESAPTDSLGSLPAGGGDSQHEARAGELWGTAPLLTFFEDGVITYGPGELSGVATHAWLALVRADEGRMSPRTMLRGTELVRMTERGELEDYNVYSLRDELSRVVKFARLTGDGPRTEPPRRDVVDVLLARDSADYVDAPRVDRVVDVPVVSAGGEIIDRPGHHAASRLFYRPAPGLDIPPLPDLSDFGAPDDVKEARDFLLDGYLGDFAWERDDDGELTSNGKASRANALAVMLTLFVREYIGAAPTPLFPVIAQQAGMGKGTLIKALTIPACGLPSMMAQAKSDEELEKRITAVLVKGRAAVVLDNVAMAIDSPSLAAMLTAETWEGRILGHSRIVVVANRTVWLASGNNMRVSSELADRCCPIVLDCGDAPVPRHRDKSTFQHEDIVAWGLEHRGELVHACLTLIQHYLEGTFEVSDGGGYHFWRYRHTHEDEHVELAQTERTMGSFERWADVVGGILAAAGVKGFLGNRDAFMDEADDEAAELASFFKTWNALGADVSLDDLVVLCESGALREVLPMALVDVHGDKFKSELGYWLRAHKGQRHGGCQLVGERMSTRGRLNRWRVRQLHT